MGKSRGKGKGKLYAIADLHLGYKFNADALAALRDTHRDDGLILAGDLGERVDEHLRPAFAWATSHFRRVWWCPGNHELYSLPDFAPAPSSSSSVLEEQRAPVLRGQAKYDACVAVAREYGVLTPEDPFVVWDGEGLGLGVGEGGEGGEEEEDDGPIVVCPLFTLYDYSFAPDDVPKGKELDWAAEQDICATDEALLHPDPYPTRQAWCEALVAKFERKLEEAVAAAATVGEEGETVEDGEKTATAAAAAVETAEGTESTQTTTTTTSTLPPPTIASASATIPKKPKPKPKPRLILANHWPLLAQLVYLPAIPRFRIWCGTRRTADWAARFGAAVVVSGHLHIRRTDWVAGVRYEECSLGYPRQWERARNAGRDINAFLREILPGPRERPGEGEVPTKWWIYGDA